MANLLKLLLLEDDPIDSQLAIAILEEAGYQCEWERVQTRADFLDRLEDPDYDVILADYNLPAFDGLTALQLVCEREIEIPFILVSGTLGEEIAIRSLKTGAANYVLKEQLARLAPAVEQALREQEEQHQRKQAEEKVKLLLKQQVAVNQLALELGETRDLNEIYHSVYRHIQTLVDAWAFIISFYEEETQLIRAKFAIFKDTLLDTAEFPPIPLEGAEKGAQSRVIHTGEPFYIPTNHHQALKTSQTEYIVEEDEDFARSALYVPMKIEGKTMGVMQLQSTRLDAYTPEDTNLLTGMANVAAVAIQNASLFAESQRQAKELGSLYESALAVTRTVETSKLMEILQNQVEVMFEPDVFLIGRYQKDRGEIRITYAWENGERLPQLEGQSASVEAESGLVSWMVRERSSLLVKDMETDTLPVEPRTAGAPVRSWIGAPLLVGGSMTGFISVQALLPQAFDEDDLRLLELLGNQAALALENSRLFEQTNRSLQRLEALRSIDQSIASSFDLAISTKVILDQVVEQLGVDAAALLLYQKHLRVLEFSTGTGFLTDAIQHTTLKLGQGYAGKAALERRRVYIPVLDYKETGFLHSHGFKEEGFVVYFGVPLITKGELVGVLEIFHRSQLDLDQEWVDFMENLAGQTAIAIDNVTMFNELQRSNLDLVLAYDAIIEGWAKALELRDMETEGHSRRMVDLTMHLSHKMKISQEELVHIRRGALLHDIGKMGVPDQILQKPGPLNDQEWEIMKEHPDLACNMLRGIEFLSPALDIPHYHHERWDGTGYPQGLKGEKIPLAARIFAIVDVWDALRSDQPYRKAWTDEKALAHINEQSGKHFDPQVINAFMEIVAADKKIERKQQQAKEGEE